MNKEDLLKRLEELNTVTVLRKTVYDEYRQILNDLEQLGVPPLSLTIQKEDRDTLLTSFPEDRINVKLRNALIRNGIKTVGDLLDLNRLDTINYAGFGDRKWAELYRLQKTIYNSLTHKVYNSEVNNTLPMYSIQELTNIHQEMLELEVSYAKGDKWNKNRYQELLIGLNKRGQKRSDIYKDEEIDDVSIDVLNLNPRLKKLVESLNFDRMVQIMDITESAVLNIPQQGKKSWTEIIELKKQITDSQTYYLEKYKKYYMIRELPDTTEDLPLYQKCILAITQLSEILESRHKERETYIVKELFLNGTSIENLTIRLCHKGEKLVKERVRQISVEILEKIISGRENPLIDNAFFSDDFINELNKASQELIYCPLAYANQVLQAPADFNCAPIIRLLGLNIMDVTKAHKPYLDSPRLIATDDPVLFIAAHFKVIYETMSVMALPASKDDIISQAMNRSFMSGSCDINVFEKILAHHSWIEVNDNQQYSFIYSKLKRAETKAARIVYEQKKVTTSDIQTIDAQKMQVPTDQGLNINAARIIAQYPWVSRGAKNNELIYKLVPTSSISSLRVATENYAKQHVVFKFDDMVRELKAMGYDGYADKSFRVYVLKYCVPSNKDGNILCLESEIQNHNPGTWRSRTIQGTTNWVINSCVKILGDKKMKKAELNKLVLAQPESDSYNIRNIYSVYLVNYCCDADNINPNKLFILDSDSIQVNKQCLDEGLVDLETIGTINRQPDYYMDVLTEIVNQLKQAEDQRMKMVQLRQICSPLITHPSKINIFYNITNKLPDEVEKVEIDGVVYLQLKKDKLAFEKSYSLPDKAPDITTSDDAQVPEPEVIETAKPEKKYIRGKIDWDDMAHELQRELEYYNRWWDIKGITLDEGIGSFVTLLKDSQDEALHGDVSRHIFEFLTQKLDRYDLHDHMKSIVLGAEPIIRGIYMQNNSTTSCPRTRGLADCLALVPELHQWVDDIFEFQSIQKYHDFRKTYLGFYGTRNKFAHGVSVDMNSGSKYQAIYSYLALYIYIFCRFKKA